MQAEHVTTIPDAAPLPASTPANLRDLRGLLIEQGALLRGGRLYRSDAPRPGDSGQTSDVTVWPPRTVIDLGAPVERGSAEHPLAGRGTRVHHIPLGADLSPGSAALRQAVDGDLAGIYQRLAQQAAPRIAEIVEIVATAPFPVLVHCTAGKDRTGIVVAILLRGAGVRRADVIADYERSNLRLVRLWNRLTYHGVEIPANKELLGVNAANIVRLIDDLEGHPDGLAGWLAHHEVDPDHLHALRQRLTGHKS